MDCNHPAISLTAAGGVSYVWNNGLGNTASVNITSPGVYSVLVTDANGCSATAQISITQNLTTPGATIINQTGSTQLNCNTTSIHLTATGNGSYSWDGGLGNQADVYLTTPGTYTLTVTGVNGCTSVASVTITQSTVLTAGSTATDILCHGGNATVTVTANGGTAPFIGTGTFNVTAGTHTYNITDANGCTASTAITVSEPDALTAASSATAIACHGGNATVTVSASGGTAPYTGTGIFNEAAGTYTYNVTDANGCTTSTSITVTEQDALQATSSATAIACHGGNATVTVSASGGTGPYTGSG
ncbi:MAG: hypothetical protein IPP93_16725, partial [Chitinophagaceae bacterium]|nr:hypothetical protein [Chitinophagaceae bacterium]